jgi:hypothetical protein
MQNIFLRSSENWYSEMSMYQENVQVISGIISFGTGYTTTKTETIN